MDEKTQAQLKEIFQRLPAPIQNAITSADIQKRLRDAADSRKLHIDQWEILENEVLMTLFGLKPIEKLQENIQKEVGMSQETAASLAGDISEIVFVPIRQELERELEHPEAKVKETSGVEAAREQMLTQGTREGGQGATSAPTATQPLQPATSPPVAPATPPPTPPTEKAIRAPASGAYKPGEPSIARKDIHDDPYREPPA